MEGTTPETGNTVQVCVSIIGPIDISYSLCIEEYVHNESCSLLFLDITQARTKLPLKKSFLPRSGLPTCQVKSSGDTG